MTFEDLLAVAGVIVLPVNQRCGPGKTHAVGVLKSIDRQGGAEHLARVFACIAAAGELELWSETIERPRVECKVPAGSFGTGACTQKRKQPRRWCVRRMIGRTVSLS
jgi:hypothetical protein